MESREAIMVGGGQAGLATAYELKQRGVDCLVLEAHPRIGDSWRRRWDSLRLFTPAWVSGLPGSRFPGPGGSFPTKDEMADYLESYAEDLPVRTSTRVHSLRRVGTGYALNTSSGTYTTPNVVIATGYDSPKIPALASQLSPDIKQLHACDYRNAVQLSGDVLVVGAGTSGVEIALEAAEAGHATALAGRATGAVPPIAYAFGGRIFWWQVKHLLTLRTPIGRRIRAQGLEHGAPLVRLKMSDVLRAGVKRLPRVTGVKKDGLPVFADDTTANPGTIVWCTGFTRDYSWVEFEIPMDGSVPRHRAGVVEELPGLYFMGLPFQTGLASAVLVGVGQDASFIAATISRRLATEARSAAIPLQPEPVAGGLRAPVGDAAGTEG